MKYFLSSLAIIVAVIALILSINIKTPVVEFGHSVGDASYATSTNSTWGTVSTKMLRTNASGVLNSVLITNATAGSAFELRDATSTTDVSSTTIAVFGSGTVSGTYQFYTVFTRGLAVLMTSGNIASTTITWQ